MLKFHGSVQGTYQLLAPVNDNSIFTWTSDTSAIWCFEEWKIHRQFNIWYIGSKNRTGDNYGQLFAKNITGTPYASNNQWYYWNGSYWKTPSHPNDISVKCIGTYFFLNMNIIEYLVHLIGTANTNLKFLQRNFRLFTFLFFYKVNVSIEVKIHHKMPIDLIIIKRLKHLTF